MPGGVDLPAVWRERAGGAEGGPRRALCPGSSASAAETNPRWNRVYNATGGRSPVGRRPQRQDPLRDRSTAPLRTARDVTVESSPTLKLEAVHRVLFAALLLLGG